jgi:hypothetical protein
LESLSSAGARLKAYREYLGFSFAKMEEFYKVPASNWEYSEKKAKAVSPELLGVLRESIPPKGREAPNISWILTGEGEMLLGRNPFQMPIDLSKVVTLGFPEKEIMTAVEMVYAEIQRRVGIKPVSGVRFGIIVASMAELLVRGKTQEQAQALLEPMVRALMHSESNPLPPGNQA